VWIGLSSPGRALTIQSSSGPAMGWERPKEGYVGWIDGDMLVKGSPNRDASLAWLNHIHSRSTWPRTSSACSAARSTGPGSSC